MKQQHKEEEMQEQVTQCVTDALPFEPGHVMSWQHYDRLAREEAGDK